MLKGMEGVMMNEVGGGRKEVVCAQLSCGDPQVGLSYLLSNHSQF